MDTKCRLAWKSKLTGAEGRGDLLLQGVVEAAVANANERFPDLNHWSEPVDRVFE